METIQVKDRQFKPYMPEAEIQECVRRVADAISHDYSQKKPILCPVLTGSYLFVADLTRYIAFDAEVSFVRYASYDGMSSSGNVKTILGFPEKCKGRDVIIVEDIIDSGLTMKHMLKELEKLEPASIAICTFFYKPGNFKEDFKIDYIGKEIPNDFIVGYGLDYDGVGRTYRDVYVVDDEE